MKMLPLCYTMLWKRMEGWRMTRMKKGKNDEWKNENECMNVLRYLMAYVWMNDGTKLRVRMAAILYGPPGMAHLSVHSYQVSAYS